MGIFLNVVLVNKGLTEYVERFVTVNPNSANKEEKKPFLYKPNKKAVL